MLVGQKEEITTSLQYSARHYNTFYRIPLPDELYCTTRLTLKPSAFCLHSIFIRKEQ